MAELCGVRATGINNGLTCGKPPHDIAVDPVHRFVAADPQTLEWTDPRAAAIRTEQDVAEDPRPLGWLFDQSGSRWSRG